MDYVCMYAYVCVGLDEGCDTEDVLPDSGIPIRGVESPFYNNVRTLRRDRQVCVCMCMRVQGWGCNRKRNASFSLPSTVSNT